ncbi:hypothetical protein ACNUDM_11735 [Vibrio chaetopteri]|uniref:hypothetical protein n=1 Tax=Vibrio chaetopteri TaxID=3016528 RepID=UPI003AB3817E
MFSRITTYLVGKSWLCRKQEITPSTEEVNSALCEIEGSGLDALSESDAVTESDWRFISSCLNYGERRGREKLDD